MTESIISGKKCLRAMFIYWVGLVLWQNIQSYQKMTTLDILFKLVLILYLVKVFGQSKSKANTGAALALVFAIISFSLTIFIQEKKFSLRIVVDYVFPLLLVFLTYVRGNDNQIAETDYLRYLDGVIIVVTYMALYSLFFKSIYFTGASSISIAYGNSLSSFLVSNHEYGMYLLFGITACCYQLMHKEKANLLYLYYICIILFMVNIIFTYSRTSQISTIGFLTIFLYFSKDKKIKIFLLAILAVAALYLIISSVAQSFVTNIVIRADKNAGRFEMWESGIIIFKNADFLQKLFGLGYGNEYLWDTIGHSSFHNAYLTVLNVNGLLGLLVLLFGIISTITTAIKCSMLRRNEGSFFLGLAISMILLMFSNTAVMFYSPIDSSMMTFFCVIIPKYMYNYYKGGYNTEILKEGTS